MNRFTSVRDVFHPQALVERGLRVASEPLAEFGKGRHLTLGLLFFNPSLRTRMSSQKAAYNLGMDVIVVNVGSDGWTLETRDGVVMDGGATEHIKEAAGVMAQYCDILGIRSFASLTDRDADYREDVLEKFIRHAGVPVISLESATRHPLQSLADMITIEQYKEKDGRRDRPKVVLTWAPHPKALPQAVANSFAEWAVAMDYEVVIAHPKGYALEESFSRGSVVTDNQDEALRDADFVYAKNWSSYEQYGSILSKDMSWQVTPQKMSLTNNARFMHCLPVRRNMIVHDEVIDSPASIVLPQAKNRVASMQTVLEIMLEQRDESARLHSTV
ncbi:MAG: N-acetylornithine carbamoyltransferase [Candidatus Kapaibacterium sp.]